MLKCQFCVTKAVLVILINTTYVQIFFNVISSLAVMYLNKQHQLIIAALPQFWSIYFSVTKNVDLKTFNYKYEARMFAILIENDLCYDGAFVNLEVLEYIGLYTVLYFCLS